MAMGEPNARRRTPSCCRDQENACGRRRSGQPWPRPGLCTLVLLYVELYVELGLCVSLRRGVCRRVGVTRQGGDGNTVGGSAKRREYGSPTTTPATASASPGGA